MYNAQMSHLWLHQDEELEKVQLSMKRFERNLIESGLFKNSKGHYTSLPHCLKMFLDIINYEGFDYDFINDHSIHSKEKIWIDHYEKEPDVFKNQNAERVIYITPYRCTKEKAIYTMRRVFGQEFYNHAKKLSEDKNFKYNSEDNLVLPIFNDPGRKRYKVVYQQILFMVENAIKYLDQNYENILQDVIYRGLYNGEEVFLRVSSNYQVKIYTDDIEWSK